MRVFWCDREGNHPPSEALFKWHCFFPEIPSPFQDKEPFIRVENLPPPAFSLKVLKRVFSPEKNDWIQGIQKALKAIDEKALKKVVLARTWTLELADAPDPFAITAALRQKSQGAFVFCFQSGDTAFLGASPERLFFRKGRNIFSEAMAGTRKRGKNAQEDEILAKELLTSSKDLREFSPVQEYLQTTLFPLCKIPLNFTPVSIHRTQNVQHLYSQCTGRLKEETTDEEILSQLHPTPALCGSPKEKAYSLIRQLEPFERGLYGGTLGWSTPEESEWIVGIRSCLIQGKKATLFSGTGIVEGSNPISEWDELDQKLKLYEGIFG